MTGLLPNHGILCTGLSQDEKDRMFELSARHGAHLLPAFSSKNPAHIVITRNVRSLKYRATMRLDSTIPVVTPQWLIDSDKAGRLLDKTQYRVGPFYGLTICFSGLAVDAKAQLTSLVEGGHGKHSGALDRTCSHLVTITTDSPKYVFAIQEKISVVSTEWLTDSIKLGFCQDEKKYMLHCNTTGRSTGVDEATILSESRTLLRSSEDAKCLAHEPHATADEPGDQYTGGDPALQEEDADDYDDMGGDDDAVFLDGARIMLTGLAPRERLEALRLCREGAAKRFDDSHPTLTHIVVGGDITPPEAATIIDHVSAHRHTAVVGLDWLRRSCTRMSCLPADDRFTIPLSTLQSVRVKGVTLQVDNEKSLSAVKQIELSTGSAGKKFIAPAGSAGTFNGCYFTLIALSGLSAEGKARELVQRGGGRTFHSKTVQAVKGRDAKVFAICPPSLLPTDAQQLRNRHADFRIVDDNNRFTLYWLELCLTAGQILPAMRGAPCYQPLPYTLPLPGMEAIIVCISGFSAPVRDAIAKTVQIVGGKVTLANMTRHNTHLICAEAKGTKYDHCNAFGVLPVTADWLVDSIEAGKLQPTQHYKPRLPLDPHALSFEKVANETVATQKHRPVVIGDKVTASLFNMVVDIPTRSLPGLQLPSLKDKVAAMVQSSGIKAIKGKESIDGRSGLDTLLENLEPTASFPTNRIGEGSDLCDVVEKVSSMLDCLAGHNANPSSQIDDPPMPHQSNKRRVAEVNEGRLVRTRSRLGTAAAFPIEMSQKVGYDSHSEALADSEKISAAGNAVAKKRLMQMVESKRVGTGGQVDILSDLNLR